MHENEMLQAILNEMRSMIHEELKPINQRLESLESGQMELNRRLDTLEEGQKAIRRDVARVDRKLDRLSADVGDTLVYVTENVDTEINQIRKAK